MEVRSLECRASGSIHKVERGVDIRPLIDIFHSSDRRLRNQFTC